MLLCPPDVQVEARAGGQMGEKAEVSSAVALRSGRGLYLSTLTPAVSVLRGPAATGTAAQQPIRAQRGGGRSHMHIRQGKDQQSNHVGMEAEFQYGSHFLFSSVKRR